MRDRFVRFLAVWLVLVVAIVVGRRHGKSRRVSHPSRTPVNHPKSMKSHNRANLHFNDDILLSTGFNFNSCPVKKTNRHLHPRSFGIESNSRKTWPNGQIHWFLFTDELKTVPGRFDLDCIIESLNSRVQPFGPQVRQQFTPILVKMMDQFSKEAETAITFHQVDMLGGLERIKGHQPVLVVSIDDSEDDKGPAWSTVGLSTEEGFLGGLMTFVTDSITLDVDIDADRNVFFFPPVSTENLKQDNLNVVKRLVLHELFHVTGGFHEHQRPDAEQFIEFKDKIGSQMRTLGPNRFRMSDTYDYLSISHYRVEGSIIRNQASMDYYERFKNQLQDTQGEPYPFDVFYSFIGEMPTLSPLDRTFLRHVYAKTKLTLNDAANVVPIKVPLDPNGKKVNFKEPGQGKENLAPAELEVPAAKDAVPNAVNKANGNGENKEKLQDVIVSADKSAPGSSSSEPGNAPGKTKAMETTNSAGLRDFEFILYASCIMISMYS